MSEEPHELEYFLEIVKIVKDMKFYVCITPMNEVLHSSL